MIRRLRQHAKRSGVLTWALVLMFAVAPALSSGFATATGAFAQTMVHSHDHGDEPHSHHHHHHHDHDRADGVMIGDLDVPQDGQPGHGDHGRLHVHYDAACPSIIVPAPVSLALDRELAATVDPPTTKALRGSSPGRLLRPPIV